MTSIEAQAGHYAEEKVKELEAKLSRTIRFVELTMFVAVATVVLVLEYLVLGSIDVPEGLVGFAVGAVAALATGRKLWGVYNEIKEKAIVFVKAQEKKVVLGH